MEKTLRWVVYMTFAALFLFVPLIMSTATSEMFEFPKMLLVYIGAVTVFSVWAILRLWYALPLRHHPLLVWVGMFVISQTIATITSIDPHTSLFGYYGRFNGGLLSTVAYAMLLFVASQLLSTRSFTALMRVSMVTSVIILLWGLPGRLVGVDMSCILFRQEFSNACWTNEFRPHERMFSTLGQPNWLGTYLVAHVFLGVHSTYLMWQRRKNVNIRRNTLFAVSVLYCIGMVWGVWLTASRSSQLGLGAGILALCMVFLWQHQRKRMVFLIGCATMVVVLGVGGWYANRMVHVEPGAVTHSGTIRLIVWEGALRLAMRYPLTGTGPETFAYSYFLTRPEAHNTTSERDLVYNKAHNELLNMLATSGIVGVSAYVLMIWTSIRTLFQKPATIAYSASLIAISVTNIFGFSTSTAQLLLYVVSAWGIIQSDTIASSHAKPTTPYRPLGRIVRTALSVSVCIGWVVAIGYVYRYYRADTLYARALNYQYAGSYLESVQSFVRALSIREEHVYANKLALTLAQTAYALGLADKEGEYTDSVLRYASMAEDMQTRALTKSPRNPLYWKDRAKMYGLLVEVLPTNEKDNAQSNLNQAIQQALLLAPTDLAVRTLFKDHAQ